MWSAGGKIAPPSWSVDGRHIARPAQSSSREWCFIEGAIYAVSRTMSLYNDKYTSEERERWINRMENIKYLNELALYGDWPEDQRYTVWSHSKKRCRRFKEIREGQEMDMVIYTYGGGWILYKVFYAIAMLMNGGGKVLRSL